MQQSARILLFGLGIALSPCIFGSTQEPSDPKALMLAASKLNNLTASDSKPWHIKASFQLLDDQGVVTDEGTYEEFWAGPKQNKIIYTAKTFARTDYINEKGDFVAGLEGTLPNNLISARNDLVFPFPGGDATANLTYSSKTIETGGIKLTCLAAANVPTAITYCLAPGDPVLRLSAHPFESVQILHNRILHLDGRATAGDLKFMFNGKLRLALHVDTLEPLNLSDDALFNPPPDAKLLPPIRRVTISPGIAQGLLEYAPSPVYPDIAKADHTSGTVVIHAIIAKDGKLSNPQAVSGPKELQAAALDAVRLWRYRPYLLNGDPVEVDTTVNVIFQLPH
jgi:TonB family protein